MKYQFRCPECEGTTEVEAPIEEGPGNLEACFPCSMFGTGGMVWMKRVWSAAPAIFRGGGWASKG